jgi:hypothetical protein
MRPKNYAWAVNLASWFALGVAGVHAVIFQISLANGYPFDPAIASQIVVLAVIGIVAALLAKCLKSIEARLAKLETSVSD